ncbi:MAG: PaaI family thioesterase [Halospina sp.]
MDIQELAHGILKEQPFSQHVGAELTSTGEKNAEISLDIIDELKQQHGFVHGGVLSYLADNSITFSGGIALGGDALTSEFKINYIRPAKGEKLIARSIAESVGKRQAVCTSKIYAVDQGEEKLCAIAQGTVVDLT